MTVPMGSSAPEDDWLGGEGIPLVGLSSQDFIAADAGGGGDVSIGGTLGGFEFEDLEFLEALILETLGFWRP